MDHEIRASDTYAGWRMYEMCRVILSTACQGT